EGEDDPGVPKDYLTQNLIGEFHYMLGVTFERVDWRRARSEFREAVEKAPRNDVLHYNLGLIYGRNGMYHRAAESFRRVHQISPKGMASASERASKARGSTLAEASIEAAERELARLHRIEQTLIASDPQLSSLPPGSAAWHRRMAILLDSASDPLAARGHWLLAEEAEAGS
ncbi:MAG TPA: tetratricopeptide repeat protein, partial [Thermoanaerobaculia bacterium]|nr:tetratricopeptide repeat protein [Thermoanaerobaculia bacterium]